MPKKDLKVKIKGELDEMIKYLESIVTSLKEGTVVVQKNNSFITLKPQNEVQLEIEAEQKKDKEELSIEMSWKTVEVISEETPSTLVITSKEPDPLPEEEAEEETA
jgi:amphi-Trp domain-containing protein